MGLPEARIGEVIGGRYRLVKEVGKGGSSVVYLAQDMRLPGKHRAVKIVRGDAFASDYREEARIMMRLSHPQLPDILDVFEDAAGNGMIVMEYVDGTTLDSLMRKAPVPDAKKEAFLLSIASQVSELLGYLHTLPEGPIIYRDLKPSNMMVDSQGRLRLIDFGIARVRKGDGQTELPQGTDGFAAPEQYRKGTPDPRSDLYNLGAVLFYMLAGGRTPTPERLRSTHWGKGLSEETMRVVWRLLELDPDRRYRSAGELRQALERIGPHPASKTSALLSNQGMLIVVGGIARGCGTTFTASTIARTLHAAGVRSRFYELENGNPQLRYDLEWMKARISQRNYETGRSSFYPQCEAALAFEGLHGNDGVVIVDLSTDWESPESRDLCALAHEIVFVADCHPARFHAPDARRRLSLVAGLGSERSVTFAANRIPDRARMVPWLGSFPRMPALRIPEMKFEELCKASAKRIWPQDGKAGYRLRKTALDWLRASDSYAEFGVRFKKGL